MILSDMLLFVQQLSSRARSMSAEGSAKFSKVLPVKVSWVAPGSPNAPQNFLELLQVFPKGSRRLRVTMSSSRPS